MRGFTPTGVNHFPVLDVVADDVAAPVSGSNPRDDELPVVRLQGRLRWSLRRRLGLNGIRLRP